MWKEQLDLPLLYLIHKKQKLHSLVTGFTPGFWWWSVLLIFLVFCVVFFALFVFLLCIVYPMLSFFLDFPFLIAPSVFDNVYLHKCPCKYRYISVLAKCSTKPLSKLSTSILSAVKPGFRITVTLDTQELVWNRCGFWQISKIC